MIRETENIINRLTERYAGDPDALDIIERMKKEIEYLEKREKEPGYSGMTSLSMAHSLEDFLHDWF